MLLRNSENSENSENSKLSLWPSNLMTLNNIAEDSVSCMSPDSDFQTQTQTQIFRLRFFLTIVSGLNLLFFRYLSKIDARAHLRLYFKHICVVLLFFDFPENYLCAAKENNFGAYPSFDPLDQANLRCF